jgi:ABC-type multidrug transport system fused ATPase/permease subunit
MYDFIMKFRHFWIKNQKWIFLSLFLSILQPISLIPIGISVKRIFDNLLLKSTSNIYFICFSITLICIIINTCIVFYNRHVSLKLVKRFITELRELLIIKLIYSKISFNIGNNIDFFHFNLTHDTDRIDNFIASLLTQFLPSLFISIGLSLYLIYLDYFLFTLYLFIIPFLFIFVNFHRKKMNKIIKKYHQDYSRFSSGVLFVLKYFDLIKISSSEENEADRQIALIKNVEQSSKNIAWIQTFKSTVNENIFFLGGVGILLVGAYQVNNKSASPGSIISFYIILNFFLPYLRNLVGFIPTYLEGLNSLKSISKIVDHTDIEIKSSSIKEYNQTIKFDNVSYSYGNLKVFDNINFEVQKNQMYFITGESGSGKTTLMKLLMGFYSLDSGRILVDGKCMDISNLIAFRKKVGFLMQEPLFFRGSIYENLLYGSEMITKTQIEEVCRNCLVHDFIMSLPKGYDTEIGNNGVKLSGGQKQRIAIARALLKVPELLILDEPDKNLNEESIIQIIEYLKKINQTTVVITHNYSIIKKIGLGFQL